MADEVTATKKSTPVKAKESEASKKNAAINDALDAAAKAMVDSGMSESDAEAFLNSARPRGVSTVVGNLADLNRSSGLDEVTAEPVEEDRLKLSHKIDKDAKPDNRKTF